MHSDLSPRILVIFLWCYFFATLLGRKQEKRLFVLAKKTFHSYHVLRVFAKRRYIDFYILKFEFYLHFFQRINDSNPERTLRPSVGQHIQITARPTNKKAPQHTID